MKKILLGTTAFLVASVAMAAEAPKAAVSGDAKASLQSHSQTDATTRSRQASDDAGWRVQQGGEIHFTATGKTDSGLTYTGKLEHNYIGVNTDEAWISLSDTWGKLILGRDASPAGDNYIGGQTVLSGTGGGWDGDTNLAGAIGAGNNVSGKNAKVMYYLPSIAGLDVGVSIAPGTGSTTAAGSWRNAVEASAQYTADLGGAKVTLGGTYAQAKYNLVTNTNATPGSQEADFNNYRGYNYGAKVVLGAVSVAAGHTNHGKGGIAKTLGTTGLIQRNGGTLSSIGVGYDLGGGTTVGVGYGASRQSLVANSVWKSSANSAFWTAGVSTSLAPGLSAFGEFNSISGSTGRIVNGGYSGNEVIVGTKVSF